MQKLTLTGLLNNLNKNNMKQTAVEWLIEQISSSKYFYNLMEEIQSRSTIAEHNGILHQAKEMEKEYQDNLAIEFTYYLSDWHTKKRVKQLLKIYKKNYESKIRI
jgi:phosphoribosylformylglycinamidine (FGAM) synthase-like amidotransferase family enzyme